MNKKRRTFYIEDEAHDFLLWLKENKKPGKSMSDYLNEFIFKEMKKNKEWKKDG